MGACKVCGGDLGKAKNVTYHADCFFAMHGKRKSMKRPTSVQGTAGKTKTKPSVAVGITQMTDTIFHVQGSGAKPYVVDLDGTDPGIKGPTETCTCPNWKIERNRRFGAGTFAPDGYRCKHIEGVLLDIKGNALSKKAKELSAAEAQAVADEIMSTFVKKK